MMEKLSADAYLKNYKEISKRIENAAIKSGRTAEDIILLAATKTVDVDTINFAISNGITHIGENKVQEFLSKNGGIIDCHRHFIGHLQTNKVKDIIDKVEMIHSVDSIKLAKEISKQAAKYSKTMDILLEINIGDEESKWGFSPDDIIERAREIASFPSIRLRGIMAIPPICEECEENRKFFKKMNEIFIDIRAEKLDNSNIDILSMGMSDDFDIAIEEGANIVRIGTALFGSRNYVIKKYKGE